MSSVSGHYQAKLGMYPFMTLLILLTFLIGPKSDLLVCFETTGFFSAIYLPSYMPLEVITCLVMFKIDLRFIIFGLT